MIEDFYNETRNIYLATSLYDCIDDNDINSIKQLLKENKANPNTILPDRGIAPFHFAVGSNNEQDADKIIKLLLSFGADPNLRSEEDLTPVHIAAAWGRLQILKTLLEWGGDPLLKDEDEKTCLDYAKDEQHGEVVEFLEYYLNNDRFVCNVTFNKLTLQNGTILAEYGIDNENDNFKTQYIRNWCNEVTNEFNSRVSANGLCLYDSFTDSDDQLKVSRESGFMTIYWDSSTENILNNCIIEETLDEDSVSNYVTCNSQSKSITDENLDSLMTLDLSKETEDSYYSVIEEYRHVDPEKDIVLIEQRCLVNPRISETKTVATVSSKKSSIPSEIVLNYDTDTLRNELTYLGEIPGPITKTTKRVYLRKLHKLKKNPLPPIESNKKVYSIELEKTLRDPNWTSIISQYEPLEQTITDQFNTEKTLKKWREGLSKTSFTYLLLDPRLTDNLPKKSRYISPEEAWRSFIDSVFYIGKGKRSRPFAHLYEAVNCYRQNNPKNKKISRILDIWSADCGVVCLHVFQNVIPVEAYTREAAMINAIMLKNLCNVKYGDFYGVCASWPQRKKRQLGVYLLYRAMLIFFNEGERQLRPDDIGK